MRRRSDAPPFLLMTRDQLRLSAQFVTAAEANRDFSKLLRSAREGDFFIVTSHGTPVARLVPIEDDTAKREEAKQRYLDELMNERGK